MIGAASFRGRSRDVTRPSLKTERASVSLLRESTRIFLERAPGDIDPTEVGQALIAEDGVVEVHDLHVWTVTSGFPALSAHVLVDSAIDCHERRLEIERLLGERFKIEHTTLQVDHHDRVLPTSTLGRRIHPEPDDHH